MLPCLEWAAFRTWVMPSLHNVFLFCATALQNTQKKTDIGELRITSYHNAGSVLINFSLVELTKLSFLHASNMRHSHISYVQVGPDFIHWCELQCAAIQDELQFFNEHQVLSLVAPWHSPWTQTAPPTDHNTAAAVCVSTVPSLPEPAQWETWAGGCLNAPKLALSVFSVFSLTPCSYLTLLMNWLFWSVMQNVLGEKDSLCHNWGHTGSKS